MNRVSKNMRVLSSFKVVGAPPNSRHWAIPWLWVPMLLLATESLSQETRGVVVHISGIDAGFCDSATPARVVYEVAGSRQSQEHHTGLRREYDHCIMIVDEDRKGASLKGIEFGKGENLAFFVVTEGTGAVRHATVADSMIHKMALRVRDATGGPVEAVVHLAERKKTDPLGPRLSVPKWLAPESRFVFYLTPPRESAFEPTDIVVSAQELFERQELTLKVKERTGGEFCGRTASHRLLPFGSEKPTLTPLPPDIHRYKVVVKRAFAATPDIHDITDLRYEYEVGETLAFSATLSTMYREVGHKLSLVGVAIDGDIMPADGHTAVSWKRPALGQDQIVFVWKDECAPLDVEIPTVAGARCGKTLGIQGELKARWYFNQDSARETGKTTHVDNARIVGDKVVIHVDSCDRVGNPVLLIPPLGTAISIRNGRYFLPLELPDAHIIFDFSRPMLVHYDKPFGEVLTALKAFQPTDRYNFGKITLTAILGSKVIGTWQNDQPEKIPALVETWAERDRLRPYDLPENPGNAINAITAALPRSITIPWPHRLFLVIGQAATYRADFLSEDVAQTFERGDVLLDVLSLVRESETCAPSQVLDTKRKIVDHCVDSRNVAVLLLEMLEGNCEGMRR